MEDKDLDHMVMEMLSAARRYCAANDIEMTTLGGIIMNNGAFFADLATSNNCTIKTYRKVMGWFTERRVTACVPKRNGKGNSNKEEALG